MVGPLSNSRHEAFARAVAEGKSIVGAYLDAGYSGDAGKGSTRANASRLNANERIQARIKQLQEKATARTLHTLDTLVAQLVEDREFARTSGAPAAAIT